MADASIYALCHPVTGEVRYIGKANDPAARLKSHMRDCRTRSTPVYCWIKKLQSQGLQPEMRVLEVCQDWKEAEIRLIALHRQSGRLLNLADGGDQPKTNPEQLRRNANALNAGADPIKRANWNVLRFLGRIVYDMRKLGESSRAQSLSEAMAKIKQMAKSDPELLFYRFYHSRSLRRHMRLEADFAA